MKLKIGRHEYEITCDDIFMDNGACVQLLTQSSERMIWDASPDPILSKKAVKEISKFEHVQMEHGFSKGVSVFTLKLE